MQKINNKNPEIVTDKVFINTVRKQCVYWQLDRTDYLVMLASIIFLVSFLRCFFYSIAISQWYAVKQYGAAIIYNFF